MTARAEPSRMTTRFGRSLRLNGDDELVFIDDVNITPTNGFDVPGGDITFGVFFKVGYGALGTRMTLLGKRVDGDETVRNAGWYIEKTADNFLRLYLDDGVSDFELVSTNPITDDGFFHTLIVTIDFSGGTQQAEMWLSEGKQPTMGIRSVGTLDLSTVGSMANAVPFAIGGIYDGTPGNEVNLWDGEIGWAAVWDERLPETYIRGPVSRFQLPGKDDRRLIGLWHWTNMTLEDWNRGTQNDLSPRNVTIETPSPNFPPGPERFPEISGYNMTPNLGAQPATANVNFARFRPEVLSEGFFKQIGLAGAPPMEIRKMSANRSSITSVGMCTNFGRYFCATLRTTTGDEFWYYEIDPTLDPSNPKDIALVESGSILDSDFRNASPKWTADRDGIPSHLFGFATVTGGADEKFLVVRVDDPTTPTKRSTLTLAGADTRMLLYDARNPVSGSDYVYMLAQATGLFRVIDVTDLDAPVQDNSFATGLFDDGLGHFVQVATHVYVAADGGLGGVDLTDPTTPGTPFQVNSPTGPGPFDTLDAIVITATGNVATVGTEEGAGTGRVYVLWDVDSDPDNPTIIHRQVLTEIDGEQIFDMNRVGNLLYIHMFPDADTKLQCYDISDETNPQHLAEYNLSDYLGGASFAGTGTVMSLNRKALCWNTVAGPDTQGYFWLDPGEEFSALDVQFEIPDTAIQSPSPIIEISQIIHDLSQLDFEDDALGTDPPAGWTKTGSSSAVWEISEVRGLTGQLPGAAQLPRSLHVSDTGGPFVNKNLQFDITVPVALRVPGTVFRFEGYYLIRGPGSIAASDLTFRLEERGGLLTDETDETAPFIEKDRWHKFEVDHPWVYDDSDTIRIHLRTTNSVLEDIYFDSIRVGPTRKPLAFGGRVMRVTGAIERPDLIAEEYSITMVDRTWDLNRLKVSTSLPAQTVQQSVIDLITGFTRGRDGFTTNNVFPELGDHDVIPLQNQDNLGMALARLLESASTAAIFWVDYFGDVHALPVAYLIAPKPVNDVAVGWENLEDSEDGAELVTEGTVEGDQTAVPVPSGSFSNADNLSRFGQVQYFFPPTSDISTDAQAQDVADSFRDLLGDRQFEGRVEFLDEPRFQPGQILPIQVDVRGFDRAVQIESVQFTPHGNRVRVTLGYKLLQGSFTDEALRDRLDAGNQDVGTMGFDNPEFGFDVEPAMGFDAVS